MMYQESLREIHNLPQVKEFAVRKESGHTANQVFTAGSVKTHGK
jgi:hypothetical protein